MFYIFINTSPLLLIVYYSYCQWSLFTITWRYEYIIVWIKYIIVIVCIEILATKPEKHTLLKLLTSVSAKWQEIGDQLGVDSDTIEGLYTSNVSN